MTVDLIVNLQAENRDSALLMIDKFNPQSNNMHVNFPMNMLTATFL